MGLLTDELNATPFNYTFMQIIDADHFSINRMAAKVRKTLNQLDTATLDCSDLLRALYSQIEEITWRLVRHDLSEDLVMRPAFIRVLGTEGKKMAQRDREDHNVGRQVLLDVLARIETARGQVSGEASKEYLATMKEVGQQIVETFDTLGQHMAIESGEFLPYFESKIDGEMSRRLGRRYWMSLFVKPGFEMSDGTRMFDGESGYISTAPEVLVEKYRQTVDQAEKDGEIARYLVGVLKSELDSLQVEKWTGGNKMIGVAELKGGHKL